MSSGRCTICQETFDPTEISALKCGHTFHLHCVSQWLQKSSSCPVCRRSVNKSTDLVKQLFFDVGENSAVFILTQSPAVKHKKFNELTQEVLEILEKSTAAVKRLKLEAFQNEQKNMRLDAENRTLKAQLDVSRKSEKELTKLRMDLEKLLEKYDELSKEKSILEQQQVKEKERENTMLKKQNLEFGVMMSLPVVVLFMFSAIDWLSD